MGILDLLFGKKKVAEPTTVTAKATPVEPPEKDLSACYEEYFKRAFANVTGLAPSAVANVYRMVAAAEGGSFNLSAYHSQAYEKHFKGQEWSWLEYEKWDARFNQLGRYPAAFESRPERPSTEDALSALSVAELKELLKAKGIAFGAKAKKQDLLDLAMTIPNVADEAAVRAKIEEGAEKGRYALYTILMRTISFRAKGLHDYQKAKRVGATKFKTIYTYPGDKEFVEMALKENPQAMPPYFPYDLTYLQPEFDF